MGSSGLAAGLENGSYFKGIHHDHLSLCLCPSPLGCSGRWHLLFSCHADAVRPVIPALIGAAGAHGHKPTIWARVSTAHLW